MPIEHPDSLPEGHHLLLDQIVGRLAQDPRLVGVAVGGSYLTDTMDAFSDLDLVIAVEPEHEAEVSAERQQIAASLGPLLAAFTGEHVGEPRVLICLFGPPPIHVDLKFVGLDDVAERVEDPAVLWQRDDRLSTVLSRGEARYPAPDLQWIEDRFWIWIHYGATKVGRGELFEALGFLAFLRMVVFGPLGLAQRGLRPTGVRRVETASGLAEELETTVATPEPRSLVAALRSAVTLYRRQRADVLERSEGPLELRSAAESAAVDYLEQIGSGPAG